MGFYHFVLTTPQNSSKKLTLTVVEMQQMPDIEKTDSKTEISCRKYTLYNGRRNVCVNFQIDSHTSFTVTGTFCTSKTMNFI